MDERYWQPIAGGTYLGMVPSKRLPVYTRGNAGEVFPEVQYPLSYTLSFDLSTQAFIDSGRFSGLLVDDDVAGEPSALVGVFGGYTYLNLTLLRRITSRVPGAKLEDVDRQYAGASTAPPHQRGPGERSPMATLRGIRYALKTLKATDLPQQRVDAQRVDAWAATLPKPADASDTRLVQVLRDAQPFVAELFRNHLIVSGQASVPLTLLTQLCEKKLGGVDLLGRLLGGAGGVASAAPSDLLWDLGRQVAGSPVLTSHFDGGVAGLDDRLRADQSSDAVAFVRAFDAFLEVHGCRGPNEWETACETWGTQPDRALVLVDHMRAADPGHAPALRHQALVADRGAAVAEAHSRLNRRSARRLDKLVASAALYSQGREQAKTTVIRAIHRCRLLQRELARRCAARSGGAHDDLWFVTADELDAYIADPSAFGSVIAERRAMRELLATREPPFIVNGTVPPFETWARRDAELVTGVAVGQTLTGIPGCAGVARGRARIVLDPYDPRTIGPGDVLVAPLTDPAWTPLFVPVEAVVVDVGAILSHAVIVSRELGIPSVVSITDATKTIPDGALIEVDGTRGTVTILDLEPPPR